MSCEERNVKLIYSIKVRRTVMSVKLISFVLVLGLTGLAIAGNNFTGAGDGSSWDDPANWSAGLLPFDTTTDPGSTDPPWYNDATWTSDGTTCVIDDTVAAACYALQVGSYGGDNTLVMTGGTLDIGPWGFNIGRGGNWDNNHAGSFGHVLMSGGVINSQNLEIPEQWGESPVIQGELIMEGGTINTGGMNIGKNVGVGAIELKGGVINTSSFAMGPGTASIDVAGGTLIVDGDQVATIQGYIDNGWITSPGILELDFDATNAGQTTLTASGFDSPVEKASTPYPADGAVDVLPDTILSWTADPAATQHFVYLLATPADPNAPPAYALSRVALATDVVDGEGVFAPVALNEEDVLVPVELDYDTTYLWAIDLGVDGSQPYDPNTVKGDTWTFTTITDPNTVD
jgi:hypothetical protein